MSILKHLRPFHFLKNGPLQLILKSSINSASINPVEDMGTIQDPKHIYKPPLNVRFKSVDSESQFFEMPASASTTAKANVVDEVDEKLTGDYSGFFINNFRKSDLVSLYKGNNLTERLNTNLERSLAIYLYELIIMNELLASRASADPEVPLGPIKEPDHSCSTNFVIYLLSKLGLNEYPYSLLLNQEYTFKFNSFRNAKTKPTLSVVKQFQNSCLVKENYFLHNLDPELSDCQIGLDMLASACTNYHLPFGTARRRDQHMYGLRVAGSQFTFYKAFVPVQYIRSIDPASEESSETELTIYKYPSTQDDSIATHGLDYTSEKDRPSIIKMLFKLKQQLSEMPE